MHSCRSCASMDDHSNKSVCADGERQIIWAWAMDADGRKFPEGKRHEVNALYYTFTGSNYTIFIFAWRASITCVQTEHSRTCKMNIQPEHLLYCMKAVTQ